MYPPSCKCLEILFKFGIWVGIDGRMSGKEFGENLKIKMSTFAKKKITKELHLWLLMAMVKTK
jgi:hypothetical protein